MVRASPRRRVGILISGRGSNMDALIAAAKVPGFPALIEVVIANRPDAFGLERARAAGIAATLVDHRLFPTREAFEAALQSVLIAHSVDLLCNAGFMRILTPGFVDAWRDRHLNIHPSLLPLFPGLNTHERVLSSGVAITGCTVHMVRAEMDAGPILAQAAVPVHPGDTSQSLANRVLAAEHLLYPHALRLLASRAIEIVNERVVHRDSPSPVPDVTQPPLISPPLG
jgi:phosphoribosylglycinamide formyltransferase 1